jgi:integrase/recombinase XerD
MITQEKKHLYSPANERIKYTYRIHLRREGRKDEKTIIAALKHIRYFEIYLNFEGFTKFNDTIADKYITYMFNNKLSLSFINDNLRTLREFLSWLERQRGYRSKITYNHICYLNITNNQMRTAKAQEYKKSYTFEQIFHTLSLMPDKTIVDKRNKAIVSIQACCGFRVSEIRTMKIKNLMYEDGTYFVYVNPKDMNVKYAKTREADFMPLPKEIINNITQWKEYLIKQGFKPTDPIFPQINNSFNQNNLLEPQLTANEIRSGSTISNIFRNAFNAAGYEYIRPHNMRHTITRYAEKQTPEFMNAVRQSLGHSSINTTFNSYGQLSEYDQRKRISSAKLGFETLEAKTN